MEQRREQLVEEIRIAERARGLLAGLERLAGSLPEAHPVRLLAESAVGSARVRGAGYAGSAASRSRSKTEGEDLDAPWDAPHIPVGRTARRVSGDYIVRELRESPQTAQEKPERARETLLFYG